MSDEVKIPYVFSLQEQEERFKFHKFYNDIFITHGSHSKHFASALHASIFMDIWETINPDTIITEDIMRHILMFGGYTKNEQCTVWCDIREDNFLLLEENVQYIILDYSDKNKTRNLLRKIDGIKVVPLDINLVVDPYLKHFVDTFIFTKKDFTYFNAIDKPHQKVSVKHLYDVYIDYCAANAVVPVTKAKLTKTVCDTLGVTSKAGYYDGQSGIRIIEDIYVPYKEVEIGHSLFSNLGVMLLSENTFYCNDNRNVSNIESPEVQVYLTARGKIHGKENDKAESEEQAQEEKEIETYYRREDEVQKEHVEGGTYAGERNIDSNDIQTPDRKDDGVSKEASREHKLNGSEDDEDRHDTSDKIERSTTSTVQDSEYNPIKNYSPNFTEDQWEGLVQEINNIRDELCLAPTLEEGVDPWTKEDMLFELEEIDVRLSTEDVDLLWEEVKL